MGRRGACTLIPPLLGSRVGLRQAVGSGNGSARIQMPVFEAGWFVHMSKGQK